MQFALGQAGSRFECVVLIIMHVLLFGILPDLRGQPQQGVAEGGRRRGWQFDRHQEGESPRLIQSSISPVNANVINDAINAGSRSLERAQENPWSRDKSSPYRHRHQRTRNGALGLASVQPGHSGSPEDIA